ncbi:MAG: DUF1801 domain-containing protein [Flavobacterium sp.]
MKPAESYILNLKEPFLGIALQIKDCIELSLPGIELKYKYHIPFYYYKGKMFCYLNYSSKKKYLDLCFFTHYKLEEFLDYLVTENRKIVKSIRIYQESDYDDEILLKKLNKLK